MIIEQSEVNAFYEDKKRELREWLVEYTNKLRRIKPDQKEKLLEYAENITFSSCQELNDYVQSLNTISNRDKDKLYQYLYNMEWLPKNVPLGYIDGKLVKKPLSDPYNDLINGLTKKQRKR